MQLEKDVISQEWANKIMCGDTQKKFSLGGASKIVCGDTRTRTKRSSELVQFSSLVNPNSLVAFVRQELLTSYQEYLIFLVEVFKLKNLMLLGFSKKKRKNSKIQ